jgi:peptide deformylase
MSYEPEIEARRAAALRQVRQYGDPVLCERARPVARFDDALRADIARMTKLMDDALGAGLAATQLGVLQRVLVYRLPDAPARALVNPRLEWTSSETEWFEEGCLSLPGVWVEVQRASAVRVRAFDGRGEEILLEASGSEASVVQHEIDHLDGVLVLDRVPRDRRRDAMRILREVSASR